MYANEYPSPREDALQFLETRSGRTTQPKALRFKARVQPKNPLLLEHCLGTLGLAVVGSGRSGDSDTRFTAAEILGAQFGSDLDILQCIAPTSQRDCLQEGRVVALCEGWPSSRALRQWEEPPSLPIDFHLWSRKGSYKAFFDAIADWLGLRGAVAGSLFIAINKGGAIQVGRGISAEALAQMLTKRRRQAGVKPLTWHDFRRSFAGNLLDNGQDLVTVQKLMGHASPTTTSSYDRRGEETRRKASQTLHVPYTPRGLGSPSCPPPTKRAHK